MRHQRVDDACVSASTACNNGPWIELGDHPEALTPDERDDFARRSDFVKKWQAGILRSPEQLPDLSGDRITLFWDNDHDTNEIIIRTNERRKLRDEGL